MISGASDDEIIDGPLDDEDPVEVLLRLALSAQFLAFPEVDSMPIALSSRSMASNPRKSAPAQSTPDSVVVIRPLPRGPCGAFSASQRRLRHARDSKTKRRRTARAPAVMATVNFRPIAPAWEIPAARPSRLVPEDGRWSITPVCPCGAPRGAWLSGSPGGAWLSGSSAAWARSSDSDRTSTTPDPIATFGSPPWPRRRGRSSPADHGFKRKVGQAHP